jgi:hypothetical protein
MFPGNGFYNGNSCASVIKSCTELTLSWLISKWRSKSKLCYDRRSVGQSVLVWSTIWDLQPEFYYCQTLGGLLMWGAFSDERTGLSYTIAAGPRQRSHSWIWIPLDSWPCLIVSDLKLRQPGGPGPRVYINQAQGGPLILPGTGFPFRRLLWLAEIRWRYSIQPSHRIAFLITITIPRYIVPARMAQKTFFPL